MRTRLIWTCINRGVRAVQCGLTVGTTARIQIILPGLPRTSHGLPRPGKYMETMEIALILKIMNIINVHIYVQVITSPNFQGQRNQWMTVPVHVSVTVIPELGKCRNRKMIILSQSTGKPSRKPRFHFPTSLPRKVSGEV